jgi:hypothetical protein
VPAASVDRWNVVFVLPNVRMRTAAQLAHEDTADPYRYDLSDGPITLGSPWLAVVHPEDARVQAHAGRAPAVRSLLSIFRDEMERPVQPAVLIAHAQAPLRRRRLDAVTGFRNVVALAVLLEARAGLARQVGREGAQWSDPWDFYPADVTTGDRVHMHSPAQVSILDEGGPRLATTFPHAPNVGTPRLLADRYLLRRLGAEWRRRYEPPHVEDDDGTALFRSLEIAYAAARIPTYNGGSIHDYGVQLALWVSALEVLSWPAGYGGKTGANEDATRELLESAPWPADMRWVRSPLPPKPPAYPKAQASKRPRPTPVGDVLAKLYAARNAFLHGNPVDADRLMPWGRKRAGDGATLPNAAGVLYRIALHAHLEQMARARGEQADGSRQEYAREVFDHAHAEEALRLLVTGSYRRPAAERVDVQVRAGYGPGLTPHLPPDFLGESADDLP